MFASAYLVIFLGLAAGGEAAPEMRAVAKGNQLVMHQQSPGAAFSWSDTEHALRGTVSRSSPRSGQPFKVNVTLGTIDGPAFNGPVTVTLRPVQHELNPNKDLRVARVDGHDVGQVVTLNLVAHDATGEASGQVELTPAETGPHTLQIAFHAGHQKMVETTIEVESGIAPEWLGGAAAFSLILIAVVIGLLALFRAERLT